MPNVSKFFLLPAILVLSLVCIWLTSSVLEARKQWDLKVQTKAAEVAKLDKEVNELLYGGPNFSDEFKKTVVDPVLQIASKEANEEYDRKIRDGFETRVAFESAMNSFVDKKVVEGFQESVRQLNEVQSRPLPDNIQLEAAQKAFDAAEKEMSLALKNLDDGYAIFLGQAGATGGIRTMTAPGKGMSLDAMRQTIVHIRQIIAAQRAVFSIMFSDGQKNETWMRDRWQEMVAEANTLQQAAAHGQRQVEERTKEVEQLQIDNEAEKMALAKEEAKRDQAIKELSDLRQRFAEMTKKAKQLAQTVKESEIRIDAMRGQKVVVSPDGKVPTGQVQQINESDGTLAINMGSRVGVKSGVQLHVYRLSPETKYLGIMEVVKAESDNSVGRMLPEYRQLTILPGDRVSPEITSENSAN